MTKKPRCCVKLWDGWRYSKSCRNCGTLEYEGSWYCKQHHPPTVKSRLDESPKCAYVSNGRACDTIVRGTRYCKWHAGAVRNEWRDAICAAYARLQAWLNCREGPTIDEIRKVVSFELENE